MTTENRRARRARQSGRSARYYYLMKRHRRRCLFSSARDAWLLAQGLEAMRRFGEEMARRREERILAMVIGENGKE